MTINIELKINPEYANLVPKLSATEYQELKESIKLNGLWHPIIINPERVILDGHHRYPICIELNIEPSFGFFDFLE